MAANGKLHGTVARNGNNWRAELQVAGKLFKAPIRVAHEMALLDSRSMNEARPRGRYAVAASVVALRESMSNRSNHTVLKSPVALASQGLAVDSATLSRDVVDTAPPKRETGIRARRKPQSDAPPPAASSIVAGQKRYTNSTYAEIQGACHKLVSKSNEHPAHAPVGTSVAEPEAFFREDMPGLLHALGCKIPLGEEQSKLAALMAELIVLRGRGTCPGHISPTGAVHLRAEAIKPWYQHTIRTWYKKCVIEGDIDAVHKY